MNAYVFNLLNRIKCNKIGKEKKTLAQNLHKSSLKKKISKVKM